MSHSKERIEKICLNCNAELEGRYCHRCGQENIEPRQSVWGLITHFFADITHFDGKFFSTGMLLLTKPGFLSREYLLGRRARYLNPIRMYVFTSAIFFLIFFSVFRVNTGSELTEIPDAKTLSESIKQAKKAAMQEVESRKDSNYLEKALDSLENRDISILGAKANSTREYDSIQNSLPASERDGWLKRLIVRRGVELKSKYRNNQNGFIKDLGEKFIHSFPSLLFVSLPLYALFLKLLYIRRRQFYYADHAIFLIHLYIFTFIIMLLMMGIDGMKDWIPGSWSGWVTAILLIFGIIYTLKAMKVFYGQRWSKTILKFLLLNLLAFLSLIALFILFFIISVFRL